MPRQDVVEVIWAFGHKNIQATHPTTLMVTKEPHLSETGDCIVAVGADRGLLDLSGDFKAQLRRPNAELTILIEADGCREQIKAEGSPDLLLSHAGDLVVRKSGFVCSRTLAIHADKASKDFSRELIAELKNPRQRIKVTLTVKAPLLNAKSALTQRNTIEG